VFFRLAGFLWIDSLAAPDMFLWWGEGIPWISDPDSQGGIFYLGPYLNLLPIAAVALMIVQQKYLTPPPTDDDQARQQKMMRIMMAVMGILFYKVASGLCIYFIASSLWGLAERRLLPKKQDPTKAQPGAAINAKPQPGKPGPGFRGKPKGPAKKEEATAFQKMKAWWDNVLKQAEKK
jgi:YidC/Oxa1 family membrane protein insertase